MNLAELRGPMVVNFWAQSCAPCREELPIYQRFSKQYAGRVAVLGIDWQDTLPGGALKLAQESGVTYPQLADTEPAVRLQGLPQIVLLDENGKVAYRAYEVIKTNQQLEKLVHEHLGVSMTIPDWLTPIRDGALTIRGEDITAFLPPADSDARKGAVLMLFGEGELGPDLLLTERAHDMRSHAGQVSFPGGSVDPGETAVEAAPARGPGGDRSRPRRASRSSPSSPSCGCRRATSRSRPSLAYWRDSRRSTSSTRARCTPYSGCRWPSCSTRSTG